eukprot:403344394
MSSKFQPNSQTNENNSQAQSNDSESLYKKSTFQNADSKNHNRNSSEGAYQKQQTPNNQEKENYGNSGGGTAQALFEKQGTLRQEQNSRKRSATNESAFKKSATINMSQQQIAANQNLNMIISILKKPPEFRNEKDLNNLAPVIKEIQFFKTRNIEGSHLNDICNELRYEYYQPGEFVFRQGDYGDRFYVILRGKVQVLINNPNDKKKKKVVKKKMNPVYKHQKKVLQKDSSMSNHRPSLLQVSEDVEINKERRQSRLNSKDLFVSNPKSSLFSPKEKERQQSFNDSAQQNTLANKQRDSILTAPTPKNLNNTSNVEGNRVKSAMSNQSALPSQRDTNNNKSVISNEENDTIMEAEDSFTKNSLDDESTNAPKQEEVDHLNEVNDEIENEQSEEDMDEFWLRYIEISQLQTGQSFGDLALIEQKPRMASIRCLTETHFAVLSKKDFNKVLGVIEKKKYNEKVQFLRSLPFFSQLTKTSLGKLTYQFTDISTIRNQVLYKEGDSADYVYIVKGGQFEVIKTLHLAEDKSQQTKQIFANPMRANKVGQSQSLNHTRRVQKSQIHLLKLEKGNIIGDEDLIDHNPLYTTTVYCSSLQGLVGQMKKEDFLRLENQAYAWTQLLKNAKLKQIAIARRITIKNDVEISLLTITDKDSQIIHMKNQEKKLQNLNEETKKFRQSNQQLILIDQLMDLNSSQKYNSQIQQSQYINRETQEQYPKVENQGGDLSILQKLLLQNSSLGQIVDPQGYQFQTNQQAHQSYASNSIEVDEQMRDIGYHPQHRRIQTAHHNTRRPMTANINQKASIRGSIYNDKQPVGVNQSIGLLNSQQQIQSQSYGIFNPASPYQNQLKSPTIVVDDNSSVNYRSKAGGGNIAVYSSLNRKSFNGFSQGGQPKNNVNQALAIPNHTLLQQMIYKKSQQVYKPLACTINHHQNALKQQVRQQMRLSQDFNQKNVSNLWPQNANYQSLGINSNQSHQVINPQSIQGQQQRLMQQIQSVQSMRQSKMVNQNQEQIYRSNEQNNNHSKHLRNNFKGSDSFSTNQYNS